MIQRPAWWAVLIGLTAFAVAAPLVFRKTTPRAPERAAVAPVPVAPVAVVASTAAAPTVALAPAPIAASAPDAAKAPDAAPRVPWPPSAKYVLHVGDSSLGFEQGLALEMATRFKAVGVRYEAITEIVTAGLHSFATSGKLAALVASRKPDVVLLTLGMNNLTVVQPELYEADVKSIVAQVGERACWWIGPLSINRPEQGLIAMLARTTTPCGWSNSYDLEIERQSDHIHPTQRGASHWADANWVALGAPVLGGPP